VKQLAGLAAGELAHYRKRTASKLTWLIDAINGWMWRSVFEPDRWDDWLDRASSRPGLHPGKLLAPLKAVRLFAQIVLWIPMFIGNTVAGWIVRRAALDADRCHARLAGRNSFETALEQTQIASFTWEGILTELEFLHREQQLPDSLPQQLRLRMLDVTPELSAALMESVVRHDDKPYDSRPSDAERLASIASEPKEGALRCDLPAWLLLAGKFGPQLLKGNLRKVELPA
jgi:hypothetical protein